MSAFGNLVTDGTFDQTSNNTWYGNAYNPVEGVNQADIAVAGDPWDVNLSGYVDVTDGADYTLSFDVTGDDRTIVAGIGQSVHPYLKHTDTVTVSATWQTIVMHLTAKADGTGVQFGGNKTRVFFDMGADTGAVSIDNVVLTADPPARIDRPKLDDKWHLQIECIAGSTDCWANGEQQHYTDRLENAYVSGGHLHIVAKKEEYESQGVTRAYTSARLNSKYDFKYGTVKVRAKLPKKSGLWPAIWTLGSNINEVGVHDFFQSHEVPWPSCGEIDIMEQYGTQNFVGSAMHGPSYDVIELAAGDAIPWKTQELSTSVDDFHVYSMEWTDAGITFKVDDVAYKTVTAPTDKTKTNWPFDHKHFLLLNVAVEGITHKTGFIADDFVSGEMVVDYVRIYGENGDLNWSDEFGGVPCTFIPRL